jgi:hypothetical protein
MFKEEAVVDETLLGDPLRVGTASPAQRTDVGRRGKKQFVSESVQ